MSPPSVLPRAALFTCSLLALACGKEGGAGPTSTDATDPASTGAPETTGTGTEPPAPGTEGTIVPTTAGPTGEVGGTTDDSEGDCPSGFFCELDVAGSGECDVFGQDCADGQKCVAWGQGGGSAWNATKCVPVMGDGQPGDTCSAPEGGLSGVDDCAAGAFCWDVFDLVGVCVALCTGSPDAPMCADPDTTCLVSNGGVLNLCLPSCDPLLQDCPGDDLCVPNGNGFLCSQDASGDEGQLNDPCQGGNVCDKGLLCLNTPTASSACDPNSTGCCQPYCEFPDAPCPNPDQQCLQWFNPEQFPPGDPRLDIGVCGIPQ